MVSTRTPPPLITASMVLSGAKGGAGETPASGGHLSHIVWQTMENKGMGWVGKKF